MVKVASIMMKIHGKSDGSLTYIYVKEFHSQKCPNAKVPEQLKMCPCPFNSWVSEGLHC